MGVFYTSTRVVNSFHRRRKYTQISFACWANDGVLRIWKHFLFGFEGFIFLHGWFVSVETDVKAAAVLLQVLGGESGPVPVHGWRLRLSVCPTHSDFDPRPAGTPVVISSCCQSHLGCISAPVVLLLGENVISQSADTKSKWVSHHLLRRLQNVTHSAAHSSDVEEMCDSTYGHLQKIFKLSKVNKTTNHNMHQSFSPKKMLMLWCNLLLLFFLVGTFSKRRTC